MSALFDLVQDHSCWLLLGAFWFISSRLKLPYDTESISVGICAIGSFLMGLASERLLYPWIGVFVACICGIFVLRYWLWRAKAEWEEFGAMAIGAFMAAEALRLCPLIWPGVVWFEVAAVLLYAISLIMAVLMGALDGQGLIDWACFR